ncbi:MAG: dephospho-CoA kinase [Bacteroidota bacterium]|nr:dephospho-CoA kinase [Bacteroidota bacterium]
MKKIGLTGGIGSGKTTVSRIFETAGIPVYNSDIQSKKLLITNENLKQELIKLFGNKIYSPQGELNREHFAKIIFSDESQLQKANQTIWPAVKQDFNNWLAKQTSDMVVQETALLFESGSFSNKTANITVTAPLELRIERVSRRDNVTREEVLNRINTQMAEDEKMKRSDYIINNSGKQLLIPQVMHIIDRIRDEFSL